MKKKVFSLMMMLLLAVTGMVRAEVLTVHDGTTTNGYIPVWGLWTDNSLQHEFVYPASDLSAVSGSQISSLKFYTSSSYANVSWNGSFDIYVKEVGVTTLSSFLGTSGATLVYSGSLGVSSCEMEITFTTPYTYNGGNLWVGVYYTATTGYSSSYWYGETVSGASIYGRSGNSYTVNSANFLPKTTFTYSGGGGGGGSASQQLFAVQDDAVVDTVLVGARPNGCWMEPFTFQIRNTGAATTITNIDWTPQEYFTLVAPELPVQIGHNEDIDVSLTTGESVNTEWQMVALYGTGRTAAIWTIVAEPYDPMVPDVWELACEEATTFPFVEVPQTAHNMELHNDYTLPFPEIPEGYDAVYKLVFDQDVMLNASVTQGENGKVALYREGFEGEGGPMADNYYTGPSANGGGATGGSFEAMIGDETSTTTSTYFPFHTLWNYSLAENLFLASELTEAGVTTAPMTSLSWYVSSTTCTTPQNNISIWMGNVSDAALTSTSHTTAGMTLVYTGNNVLPVAGEWNEFEFNAGNFAWDGHSNILILCQRNNGSWQGSVSWQTHNPGFAGMAYNYTDDTPGYDATTQTYTMSTSTANRQNIIFKGNSRASLNNFTYNFEAGVAGWTDIDNDGDGHTWFHSSNSISESGYDYTGLGHNTSDGFMVSASYCDITGDYYDADNYLVSPQKYTLGDNASVNFFFDYGSDAYPDYFEVCVATADNPGASDFTSIWNVNMRGGRAEKTQIRHSNNRYENWREVTVDLSAYAGQDVWVAFHHQDIDYYEVWIDDVTINTGSAEPTPGPDPLPLGDMAYGPEIINAAVEAGTYYLVASSTTPNFEVTINAEDMPCPVVEADGFAFNPTPADDADEVEPGSVTLRWNIPAYATGWRLVFGSTYYPDPNHPQTIMYPEDGSFATTLANSYTVTNLWNNTNYFWHVEFNNDGCPEGVSSPIWGFTTHLNIPTNLTAVDYTVFNDETIVLNWNAVVDRTYRFYNVYRDGQLIGSTQVNNIGATTYTDGPLAYNMAGYVYYVTAVYDEGESAPSDPVTVKVSGYGDVNGHVYEQDGTTGIAGATVTMVGQDEFGVNHTYNFTTNGQGYYSGHIYAGTYNGSAACNGYQTIYAPVQGNPIAINYNETASPYDYILDENFDPVCAVIAEYYPDSLDPESPYVKVYWGCGLPGSEIIEDFETGDFSMFDWQVDPTYPWTVVTTNPYEGTYCMKSGGAGVANVVSNMTVTVEIPADGLMSFFGKISCENSWDYGYFYIDGVQKGSFTGAGNWVEKTYDITAGEHTFQWRYTKDGSVNSNDDCFYVDYINFYKQPEPPVPGMTYDFEDGTMQGWTSVDADGDGYGWYMGSEIMTGQTGNNGSNDFVLSQSYYLGTVLYPDNYLVSPQVQLGGIVRFYACAQDASYAAEHFGLAVSTTGTNPSDFTMIQEWTMSAKDVPANGGKAVLDSRSGRAQGNWYEYTVDLSAYSGMGYVAIRHFNCSDMFYLDVDDITIGEPGKGIAETRSLDHYRVYRTNCYNDGPYTEENTVLLASVWVPDTVYIDVEWADLEPGVYKWGVGAVYSGNRGEMIEAPINWTAPQAVNMTRSFGTAEANQNGPKIEMEMPDPTDNRDYLQYCTETFSGGVGTGGGAVYWGVRFPAADLAAYAGQTLTSVGVFMDIDGDYGWTYSGNYTASVYQGGATAPGTLMSTATEYLPGDMAWHDITLTTPVTIDATQDLWLCFYTPDIAYPMAGCDYVGNVNSDFLSLDGTTWEHAGDYGLDYTWMIRGMVENGGTPGPGPAPTNNLNQLAMPRESETIWSNCLDKDMYLNGVTVNVLLNSADSPEGTTVDFTNLNEYEQQTYPIDQVILDESGHYAFESFRRGDYVVNVRHEGYAPIDDTVSIWSNTDLRYVMTELFFGVENVYVSRTGWAMWDDNHNNPGGGQGGGGGGTGGGNGDTFSVDFEAGMPAGWTTIDGGTPAGYGWQLASAKIGTGYGHNGSADCILSQSYDNNYGVVYPDNYLVSPAVTIAAGSTFSFYACGQDASYAAEHFGVFVSDNGTSDWTMVNEWTIGQKGERYSGARGQRDQSAWTLYSVDLSNFAGTKYIAIRHFNCSDMFYLDVDDIQLTSGAKGGYSVMESGMLANGTYALNITDIANFDERVIFLYNLINDNRFDVIQGEAAGMFIISATSASLDLEEAMNDFIYSNNIAFGQMDKVQAADMANAYKSSLSNSFINSLMMDMYIQSRENNMCALADPFCTDNGMYEFPAGVNAGSGETGPDYDCLYTTPNPAWYYMRIGDPGAIDIYMYSTPAVDIDFCCWGPFDDPTTPCPYGLTEDKVVDCSYSANPTETCNIPATAQTGEYYILVITNYSNQTCNINFSAVGGAGSTDCGILPPVDIIGFLITEDGEYVGFAGPTDRDFMVEGEFGEHEYCVRPIYPGEMTLPDHNYGWSMGCPVCAINNGQITCEPGAPIHAEQQNDQQIRVWWGEQPAAPVEEWLYYDDGTYATSVGAGGTLYWGTMFPAASLAPYAGTSLTKVTVHTSYACSATLNVYVGGAQPGGSPAATQTFTMTGDQEFMEITLTNPVAVDGTQNLWITFYQSGESYPADACADTGDANNRWVSVDGASWMDLATAGLPGYGWMIRGFVTNQAKGGIVSLPEFKGNVGGQLSHTAVVSKPADLSFMNRASLVKYNVYRSTEPESGYVLIGSVIEEGQTYYYYDDTPVDAGTYYYQVRAEYDNDCESEPAMAADGSGNNYVSGTTIGDGMEEIDGNVALYPNPTKGNVTIEAAGMSRITVVSVLGQVVFDTELNADTYTLNMSQFNAGMYLVRVYTENGVTVKRVTVMQ